MRQRQRVMRRQEEEGGPTPLPTTAGREASQRRRHGWAAAHRARMYCARDTAAASCGGARALSAA